MTDRAPRVFAAGVGCALLLAFLAVPAWAEDAPAAPALTAEADAPAEVMLDDVTPPPASADAPRLTRGTRARWYVEAEIGAGFYEDPSGVMGLEGASPAPFDWGQNTFDGGGALRVNIGRYIRPCERLELRTSFQGWSTDSRQTGRFAFSATPGAAAMLSPVATATIENEARLFSIEFNWWKTIPSSRRSRFSWGVGGRVVSLTDKGIAKDWVGIAADAYLEGEARNTLWAGQLMGAWHLRPNSRFEFDVIGKALAGALNRDLSEKDTSIVTGGNTTNAERGRTDFGYAFEAELRAMWRPWARVGITLSYTVLFMDDISRGHDILDFSQAATGSVQVRDRKDSLFVQTVYLGVHFDI